MDLSSRIKRGRVGAGAFCSDVSIPDRVIWRPVGGSQNHFSKII